MISIVDLINLFKKQPGSKGTELLKLLDHFYRIEETDLQELLRTRFGVTIVASSHIFIIEPDKIGSKGKITPFGDPSPLSLPLTRNFDLPPVSILTTHDKCIFKYATKIQEYEIQFTGSTVDIQHWVDNLERNPYLAATLFLYLFNRFRAAQALEKQAEDERKFIRETFSGLRSSSGAEIALRRIADLAGFDWAVVSLYGLTTEMLVPIASSDASLLSRMRAVPSKELLSFLSLKTNPQGFVNCELTLSDSTSCNCNVFINLGAKHSLYVKFGHDALKHGEPRGVISLYRREFIDVTQRERVLVEHAAREIAAWVDELDEKVEHQIMREAISTTEKRSGEAAVSAFDENLFIGISKKLGDIIQKSLDTHMNARALTDGIQCGFIIDSQAVGDVPECARRVMSTSYSRTTECTVYHDDGHVIIVAPPPEPKGLSLVISALPHRLSLLRSHIFEWLYELMGFVYHLVTVERRRLSWTHRIVHELRQPLQGLLPMGSEIRRLAGLTSVSRRQIEHYAEDMETSIMRIKVLIEVFSQITRMNPRPRPRPMQIEGDVLRPIRRLLAPHSRKRHVEITPTVAYEIIPAISSDPDLLSVVFYNLLDNAIKYSNTGTAIRIVCGIEGPNFFVDITNEGRPILPEDVPRLFEEGYRGVAVRGTEVGLGMGLSTASKIAKSLGCSIELQDIEKAIPKITFRVNIPKARAL